MLSITILHIDLDALVHNIKEVSKTSGFPLSNIFAVVKDSAYGMGSLKVSQVLSKIGITHFAVASYEEALFLRKSGIGGTILVLGRVEPFYWEEARELDITLTIQSEKVIEEIEEYEEGTLPCFHLLLDSGMHRQGLSCTNLVSSSWQRQLHHISPVIKGVYSHFHSADEDDGTIQEQDNLFTETVLQLQKGGMFFKVCHIANSAGSLRIKNSITTHCRTGIALHGGYEALSSETELSFKDVVSLTSKVVSLRDIEPDDGVSYGHVWRSPKNTRIATTPLISRRRNLSLHCHALLNLGK